MKLRRSPREIRFRLRQEFSNLALRFFPPRVGAATAAPLAGLPDPAMVAAGLRGSRAEAEIMQAAAEIMEGRHRILGLDLHLGPELRWRADPVHHRETGLPYFRRVPYLDFSLAGDHKIIWELNRHQHLTILAQACALSGRDGFLVEIVRQWKSWVAENPFHRGINWASALEVAFRALSWTWIYHLTGSRMDAALRQEFLAQLYLHGVHLEHNLSVYFSPNTHLLGEAVALHALGVLFAFPRATKWKELGARVVRQELARQVREDGAHFEQSTYYHVYALDFFLFHYLLSGKPADFKPVLESMADYLHAVMGPERRIPFIGDDDGGRLFFPRGPGDKYGRATLATCAALFNRPEWLPDATDLEEQAAWWVGLSTPSSAPSIHRSQVFPASGTVILASGNFWMLVNAGGFGPFRAGHSHSHALALVARYDGEDVLIDPGTFSYLDARWRDEFRGSAAHNTVRINGLNQAPPAGPFAWAGKPSVAIESWQSSADEDYLDASCRYSGSDLTHRRRILFLKPDTVFILDEIRGVPNATVEQFWHPAEPIVELSANAFRIGTSVILATTSETRLEPSWRSRAYGEKQPSPVLVVSRESPTPLYMGAILYAGESQNDIPKLTLSVEDGGVRLKTPTREAFFP